jgi:hypothetical protein
MQEGDISLPGLVPFELPGEVVKDLRPAGQEDDAARLPVETVNGMNPETRVTADLLPKVRVMLDPGPKKGAEVLFRPLLDAQPGRLLDDEPPATRRENGNGKKVCCHYSYPG